MDTFVSRHRDQIQGTLSGFDRLRFAGSLLRLSWAAGLSSFIPFTGSLLKNAGDSMHGLSERIKRAGEQFAGDSLRRVHYFESSLQSKEDFVRGLPAPRRAGPDGLMAVLRCVKPCRSYKIRRDPRTKYLKRRLNQALPSPGGRPRHCVRRTPGSRRPGSGR